ncbi:BrnT family toxin [Terrihabitans sp. B22-R8]|uniref:BrnT family toxin n=1 Tax=Terrihabitans sp. B22-R8 TaxID=3425128 RepID=UPI00403CF3C4
MIIVWDEPKRLANLDKHGIDLADAYDFEWASALIVPAHTGRMKAIGTLRDGTVVVVFALLGTEAVSVISMRAASQNERRMFHDQA